MQGATTDEPPVDLAVALRQAGGDTSLLIELVGIFLEDLSARLQALHRATSTADMESVRFVAHTLRGSLAVSERGLPPRSPANWKHAPRKVGSTTRGRFSRACRESSDA